MFALTANEVYSFTKLKLMLVETVKQISKAIPITGLAGL
jgi:hypothetical protein